VIKAGIPLGRIGKKEDVAGTCLFLASEAGDYVNGGISLQHTDIATIVLDGGSVLNGESKL
jgi:NAD(P)-dependent dehydrogenase (short-subunit alcohol dehydrogenase family)